MGVRTAKDPVVIHYLEGMSQDIKFRPIRLMDRYVDLIELFRKEAAPLARQVFNTGPGSCVESVQYRIPLQVSGRGRKGRLLVSVQDSFLEIELTPNLGIRRAM